MAVGPPPRINGRPVAGGVIAMVIGAIATIARLDDVGAAFEGGFGHVLSAAWPLILVAVGGVLVAMGLGAGHRHG